MEKALLIAAIDLKSQILEFRNKPILYVCSSAKEIEELVEASKKASNNSRFILLLDYSERVIERILPAFVNASIRIKEGIARSKSAQLETLLLACGTMNIGKALKDCGAKKKDRFMLFSTTPPLIKKFVKTHAIQKIMEIKLQMEAKEAGKVAIAELMDD